MTTLLWLLALAIAFVLGLWLARPKAHAAPAPDPAERLLVEAFRASSFTLAYGTRMTPEGPVVVFNLGGALRHYGTTEGAEVGKLLRSYHPDGGDVWEATRRAFNGEEAVVYTSSPGVDGQTRYYKNVHVPVGPPERRVVVAVVLDETNLTRRATEAEALAAEANRRASEANDRALEMARASRVPTAQLLP